MKITKKRIAALICAMAVLVTAILNLGVTGFAMPAADKWPSGTTVTVSAHTAGIGNHPTKPGWVQYGNGWSTCAFDVAVNGGANGIHIGYCVQPSLQSTNQAYAGLYTSTDAHYTAAAALLSWLSPLGGGWSTYGQTFWQTTDANMCLAYTHVMMSRYFGSSDCYYGTNWSDANFSSQINALDGMITQLNSTGTVTMAGVTYRASNVAAYYAIPSNTSVYQCVTFATISLVPVENNYSYIRIKKSSGNTEISDGNPGYSLSGAVYGIYSDEGCTKLLTTLATGTEGTSNAARIALGESRAMNVYVKEISAPSGYALSTDVTKAYITKNHTSSSPYTVQVSESPVKASALIIIEKMDAETLGKEALGAASLEGAQFTINYYAGFYDGVSSLPDPTRTWVVETVYDEASDRYIAALSPEYLVSGDEFFMDGDEVTMPLGTLTVEETKAPDGYLLEGAMIGADGGEVKEGVYLTQIRHEGSDQCVIQAGNSLVNVDHVIRGDLSFTKIAEDTGDVMPGVHFVITSNTTGESHEVVTDDAGYYSTASEYQLHSECGMWFGDTEIDDDAGALPYDTYTVSEVRSSENIGYALTSFEVTISENNTVVEIGNVEDSSINIETQARDGGTGTQVVILDTQKEEEISLTDTVRYDNLVPGETYLLYAELIHAETSETVMSQGEPVVSKLEFIPEEVSGSVDVCTEFDGSSLEAGKVVFFETLYHIDAEGNAEEVANHRDINDEGQTLTLTYTNISTHACDESSGTKVAVLNQTDDQTLLLTDRVTAENLVPGGTYRLLAELMDAETSEALTAEGKTIAEDVTFTASGEGTIDQEVSVMLDKSLVAEGDKVVFFETLYRVDPETGDYYKVAEHKDISSKDQTVTMALKPAILTGDNSVVWVFIVAGAAASVIIAAVILRRKRVL